MSDHLRLQRVGYAKSPTYLVYLLYIRHLQIELTGRRMLMNSSAIQHLDLMREMLNQIEHALDHLVGVAVLMKLMVSNCNQIHLVRFL